MHTGSALGARGASHGRTTNCMNKKRVTAFLMSAACQWNGRDGLQQDQVPQQAAQREQTTLHNGELWCSFPYPCPKKFYKLPAVLFHHTKLLYELSWAWAWAWMSQLTQGTSVCQRAFSTRIYIYIYIYIYRGLRETGSHASEDRQTATTASVTTHCSKLCTETTWTLLDVLNKLWSQLKRLRSASPRNAGRNHVGKHSLISWGVQPVHMHRHTHASGALAQPRDYSWSCA